jgi:hypothetical protein
MNTTKQAIYDQQKNWATDHSIPTDADGYTQTVEENLFQTLSAETRAEIAAGSGDELGGTGKRGKMQATHSSSALVCNVFDYWRSRPMAALLDALDAPAAAEHLHFEQTYPTGLRGIPPHIDVAILGDDTKPFCVESKFTEPYGSDKNDKPFEISYFPQGSELWAKHGLTKCQALAEDINRGGTKFAHLGGPQLLKHILGLANKFGTDFTLLYLWYDYPSTEAADHRKEIDTFVQHLGGEIDFRTMTYQELFQKMQGNPAIDKSYIEYLRKRYFA